MPAFCEGYEGAKNILKSNYDKTSEIVRAYMMIMMMLTNIKATRYQLQEFIIVIFVFCLFIVLLHKITSKKKCTAQKKEKYSYQYIFLN